MSISYPYAVSRIKARESELISNQTWYRLSEASDKQMLKILTEIGYSKEANQNLNEITAQNVLDAREFIKEISPDPKLTNLFLYKIDALNIKTLLKGLILREDLENDLVEGGTIIPEELIECFSNDSYEILPEKLREAVQDFNPEDTPGLISSKIDNALFKQIISDLKGKKNELLNKYFNTIIYLTNIRSLLRCRKLNWNEDDLKPRLIPDKNLPDDFFLNLLNQSDDELIQNLSGGDLGYFLKENLRLYFENKEPLTLETAFDKKAYSIIHDTYSESFSIGPIINYLLTKELQAKMLRILYIFKQNKIDFNIEEFLL